MPSAVVLGGGIAGLSAAIALCRAGYGVEVHEQAEVIEPLGAAISLWPNAVAALRRLGVLDLVAAEAAPITAMLLARQDGRPFLGPLPVEERRHGEAAYLPTRALIQRALLAALGDRPPLLGRRALAVHDRGDAAAVAFADGEVAADLVIAADGIRSPTGSIVAGNPPVAAGYGGVMALSDRIDGPPLDGLAAEYWGRDERFGVFDLGGGRRYWFYMASGPAPAYPALLDRARGWPAAVTAAVAATPAERLIPVTIHARPVPRRLAAGRVVVVGDAAHAMEPNLGQGACQALEDAVALGSLATRLPPAEIAAAFDRARRRRVAGMMRRSRAGGLAAHGGPAARLFWRGLIRAAPAAAHRRLTDDLHQLPAC